MEFHPIETQINYSLLENQNSLSKKVQEKNPFSITLLFMDYKEF